MLIKDMGVSVCIDNFETSAENEEIISVVRPNYIKLSVDVLNLDMYATNEKEYKYSALDTAAYLLKTIAQCHEQGIKVCICGIENEEQEASITKLFDFDFKQGYYYGQPKKLED